MKIICIDQPDEMKQENGSYNQSRPITKKQSELIYNTQKYTQQKPEGPVNKGMFLPLAVSANWSV